MRWTAEKLSSVEGMRRRGFTRAATALLLPVLGGLGLMSAPAVADTCPNAALRAQNDSTNLPECRAYELVTAPFKEGFPPVMHAYTDDGDKFAYASVGNFAGSGLGSTGGNDYIATRSAQGWKTAAIGPSGPTYNSGGSEAARALSPDLRLSLWVMARGDQSVETSDLYLRTPDGMFTRVGPGQNPATLAPAAPGGATTGPPVQFVGASNDLSHVVFSIPGPSAFPGTVPDGLYNIYEYVGTGNDRPLLVSRYNDGTQISSCSTYVGNLKAANYSHAMSTDGRTIFWTAACSGFETLWARVNGTVAYAVAASECTRAVSDPGGACNAPASTIFQGAAADGSRVFFTTTQQLVDEDTDQSNDLYACDIPPGVPSPIGMANACSSLHEVSGAVVGANVEGVTRISEDGARVYFVATGVLASNLGANDRAAVAGEDNLYVWHTDGAHLDGQTVFVGRLDPGDVGLWGSDLRGRPAETSDDGRYLVLATLSSLVGSGLQADTDSASDVYRYDADTGALVRLSTDAGGVGGNEPGLDALFTGQQYPYTIPQNRPRTVMTADAGTVVFQTSEALSSSDTNGTLDTYEWHAGRVSLISSGRPSLDGQLGMSAWISPSGHDIYLLTSAALTADDADTQQDVYDVRVDGGFDLTRSVPCSADACQGTRSASPGLTQSASGPSTGADGAVPSIPAFSIRSVSAAERKQLAATGRLKLTVTANTAATLSAKATATIARRLATVASAHRTLASPGTVSLALTLTKKARTQLSVGGRLTIKIIVSDADVAIDRSVTLKLGRAKAKTVAGKRAAVHVTGGRS
jgi:hypothetical protein